MTSVSTPSPTLLNALRSRWAAAATAEGHHPNRMGPGDDVVTDALEHLIEALVADYRVFVDAPHGESVDIGRAWGEPMEAAALEAGRTAWREHVESAVMAAVAERIPEAPDWLRIHPEAEQLRTDLGKLCQRPRRFPSAHRRAHPRR